MDAMNNPVEVMDTAAGAMDGDTPVKLEPSGSVPDPPPAAPVSHRSDDCGLDIETDFPGPPIPAAEKLAAPFTPVKTDKPRPHKCGTCYRCFARLEHLKRHERSHTKEKPFECPECARCFARRDLLLRHQQKLHQTSTPSTRHRHRRESASASTAAATLGNYRVRKNSAASGLAAGTATTTMRPRANTISHVDGQAMQNLMAATVAAAGASQATAAATAAALATPGRHGHGGSGGHHHVRHPSLAGLPQHNHAGLDHIAGFPGMAAALGQRAGAGMNQHQHHHHHHHNPHGLPKLDTRAALPLNFGPTLHTAPPLSFDFDLDSLFFPGSGSTINPNALHYNESPQPMVLDALSPFSGHMSGDMNSQAIDDGFDGFEWLSGFDHQMSIGGSSGHENCDGMGGGGTGGGGGGSASPSAISSAGQSGISDVMLDGSNQPVTGPSSMWSSCSSTSAVMMGPPPSHLPVNGFGLDLGVSAFSDMLTGAPISPQPSSSTQKATDPYFDTPPPALSPLSPSVVSGLNTHSLNQAYSFDTGPSGTPNSTMPPASSSPSFTLRNGGGALPVATTVTELVRSAVSRLVASSRESWRAGDSGSRDTPPPPAPSAQHHGMSPADSSPIPSAADLGRYVEAYVDHFHPSLPFLHLPTLDFGEVLMPSDGRPVHDPVGSARLLLSIAALGALYGSEPDTARELSGLSRRITEPPVFSWSEEMEVDRQGEDEEPASARSRSATAAPAPDRLRTAQAHLLTVLYDHLCGDRADGRDVGTVDLSALASTTDLMGIIAPDNVEAGGGGLDRWGHGSVEADGEGIWRRWKAAEERRRTVFAAFIASSLLMSIYGMSPAVTNSQINLLLPCNEEFFSADSAELFFSRGGVISANYNQVTFHDALQQLLLADDRLRRQMTFGGVSHDPFVASQLMHSPLGSLVLVSALHNYIWETRQRHRSSSPEDIEILHRHVEPALQAWLASSPGCFGNNRSGRGAIASMSTLLFDMAHVRLFVDMTESKAQFRRWCGWEAEDGPRDDDDGPGPLATRVSKFESLSSSCSPESTAASDSYQSPLTSSVPVESPQSELDPSSPPRPAKAQLSQLSQQSQHRERHLRKAATYALSCLVSMESLGWIFGLVPRRSMALHADVCSFECAQVLAEWMAGLQDRVGRYVGVLGRRGGGLDLEQAAAAMLLGEDEVGLLKDVEVILVPAEMRVRREGGLAGDQQQQQQQHDGAGYAARILQTTARLMDRTAIWPMTRHMATCLEHQAMTMAARAEEFIAAAEGSSW